LSCSACPKARLSLAARVQRHGCHSIEPMGARCSRPRLNPVLNNLEGCRSSVQRQFRAQMCDAAQLEARLTQKPTADAAMAHGVLVEHIGSSGDEQAVERDTAVRGSFVLFSAWASLLVRCMGAPPTEDLVPSRRNTLLLSDTHKSLKSPLTSPAASYFIPSPEPSFRGCSFSNAEFNSHAKSPSAALRRSVLSPFLPFSPVSSAADRQTKAHTL